MDDLPRIEFNQTKNKRILLILESLKKHLEDELLQLLIISN